MQLRQGRTFHHWARRQHISLSNSTMYTKLQVFKQTPKLPQPSHLFTSTETKENMFTEL